MNRFTNREKETAYATAIAVVERLEAEQSAVGLLKDIATELQKLSKSNAGLAEKLKPLAGVVAQHAAKTVATVSELSISYCNLRSCLEKVKQAEKAVASKKSINEVKNELSEQMRKSFERNGRWN